MQSEDNAKRAPARRTSSKNKPQGVQIRHRDWCRSRSGGKCSCKPAFQASVWSRKDKKRIRKSFPTGSAAKAWRTDALVALRKGTMRAPSNLALRVEAEKWLLGAEQGSIRNRSGDVYKPSALRSYRASLYLHVFPSLGYMRVTEIKLVDIQDFADDLVATGLNASTVRNTIMPLRALYRRLAPILQQGRRPSRGRDA